MPMTLKGKYERIFAVKTNTRPHGGLVWLLRTIAITILLILALVHTSRAHADEGHPSTATAWIPINGENVQPTAAWTEFCERAPAECTVNSSEPTTITLNDRAWRAITRINKRVNATVSPLDDISHWGVVDRWDYPADGYGDCEDYQLLKRRLLVKAGLPRRALRMAVVLDENHVGHAVLAAHTDQGDFILDNKRDDVLLWHQTGYVFIKSEGEKSFAWVALRNQISITSAVNP